MATIGIYNIIARLLLTLYYQINKNVNNVIKIITNIILFN